MVNALWREFRIARRMTQRTVTAANLRAEARLLTTAGVIVLAVAFPTTLALTALALLNASTAPLLPAAVGAPPIVLGYVACALASRRMLKAKALESANGALSAAASREC